MSLANVARRATTLTNHHQNRLSNHLVQPTAKLMSNQPDINAATPTAKPVPRHVAIIMDGNGRWAQAQGLPRSAGHIKGVETVRTITEASAKAGIEYLTLYAFSTENWRRPQAEVDMLMHLMVTEIERQTPHLLANNVRLRVIGDMSRLPEEARRRLMACVERTSVSTGLWLVLAISYSARWEITEAARSLARDAIAGRINPEEIDDEAFEARLSTAGMPDPDLLIRTGGDMRLSNYLLWQMAYGEIVVTDVFWPEFDEKCLHRAIDQFNSRQRRFGLTGEQVTSDSDRDDAPKTAADVQPD